MKTNTKDGEDDFSWLSDIFGGGGVTDPGGSDITELINNMLGGNGNGNSDYSINPYAGSGGTDSLGLNPGNNDETLQNDITQFTNTNGVPGGPSIPGGLNPGQTATNTSPGGGGTTPGGTPSAPGGSGLPSNALGWLSALAPLLSGALTSHATGQATQQMLDAINNANTQATGLAGQSNALFAPYSAAGVTALGNAQNSVYKPMASQFGPLAGKFGNIASQFGPIAGQFQGLSGKSLAALLPKRG